MSIVATMLDGRHSMKSATMDTLSSFNFSSNRGPMSVPKEATPTHPCTTRPSMAMLSAPSCWSNTVQTLYVHTPPFLQRAACGAWLLIAPIPLPV